MKRKLLAGCIGLGLFALASAAGAQQLIIKGEFGMKAGTMPDPGLYAGMFGDIAWADEIKLDNSTIHGPKLTQEIFGPLINWVSPYKILGANYAFMAAVPFANARAEFPRLGGLSGSTGLALSELWIVPVELGWHIKDPLPLSPGGADIIFHYAFYAPTGRYTAGAPNNTSLGMWTNELSGRLTAYFDKDRDWHGSAAVFYDINGKKQDQDWTTGNAFTFMGGLGRNWGAKGSMFSGWAGIAGYGQWQTTATTGTDAPLAARLGESRVYSIGPELTALEGALTLRYFWEYGAKFSAQGQGLYVQFILPIGK
jgi:hypothetical protein